MKKVNQQLKRIDQLINALLVEQQMLRSRNALLERELESLRSEKIKREAELQSIKAQCQNLKLAQGLQAGGEEAKEAKAKLAALMREIDRCIALLNE